MNIAIIVLLMVSVAANIWLYRRNHRNIKKVKFLFDAIDNVDFSFKFPTQGISKGDKILNGSLNRIKLFLQHTREEQMEREKYYEQILNTVDAGIMVVDSHDNILQHNQAALRLLDTDVLTHLNQVKDKLKDEHLSKHETQAMLKDKRVRIIALSDVSNELNNQEIDSWIKLIRVLTHEIMNTITPVTSLSETLLKQLEESDEKLIAASSHKKKEEGKEEKRENEGKKMEKEVEKKEGKEEGRKEEKFEVREEKNLNSLRIGLETIHKTGKELLSFVNNYRRFTHVPQPQPSLFYVEPFLQRMSLLCTHEVAIDVSPKDLIVYADESLIAHVVTNLLKNAAEANASFICIRAYTNEQEAIIIDVTNNAGIIPDDIASHIFIPFFTTKKEGSGIGLSLSRQIMRVSGGSLSLHQDKEAGTTTFRIVIP